MIPKKEKVKKLIYKGRRQPVPSSRMGISWGLVPATPYPGGDVNLSFAKYSDLLDSLSVVTEIAKSEKLTEESLDKCKEIFSRDFIRRL